MTQYLPPNLLALFAARDPIPYLPPVGKLPHEKPQGNYTGVAPFVKYFEDPKDTPPPTRIETKEERRERRRREKAEQVAYKLEQDIALWNPLTNPNIVGDPFKTLFVARINYDTSESKLRREFEQYGHIKSITVIQDIKSGKPRGYAFIEYQNERDMNAAYKHADGKKIDGRRVVVDVERGRTQKGWLPRRLGGGLGGTRKGPPDVCTRHSGREDNEFGRERFGRDDRERDRDREKDRERRRDRSRSRDRRRRDRSRERSRDRDRRRSRSRDRDRDRERRRRRSRSPRDHRRRDRRPEREEGPFRNGVPPPQIKKEPEEEDDGNEYRTQDWQQPKQEPPDEGYGDYGREQDEYGNQRSQVPEYQTSFMGDGVQIKQEPPEYEDY